MKETEKLALQKQIADHNDEKAKFVDLMAKQMQGAEIDPENSRLFVGDALWEGKADHALTAATVFAARVLLNTDEFITRE